MIATKLRRLWLKAALLLLLIFTLLFPPFLSNGQGRYATKVSAYSSDYIKIHQFTAQYIVNTDRTVVVKERIKVEFLQSGLTTFYRSLPKEQARYFDIQASCENNPDFFYYVADNPDLSDFIDVNCVGGAEQGNIWVYDISYTMEHMGEMGDNGLIIDLMGYGWTVPIYNVEINVDFPQNSLQAYTVYSGEYGTHGNYANVNVTDQTDSSLTLQCDKLERKYSSYFDEYATEGITLKFALHDGVFKPYTPFSLATRDMWWIVLIGLGAIALALAVVALTPKKQEIVTTVNIKAPDEMDPMQMGKRVDGNVDQEDITAMLYYFADKGYMSIDFSDEDDPVLIQNVSHLPDKEQTHARTLFSGLFSRATTNAEGLVSVRVSQLQNHFYASADAAKTQLPAKKTYEKRSVVTYISGGVIGLLIGILVPMLWGLFNVGGNYTYFTGVLFALPIFVILLLGYVAENYRYKWNKSKKTGMRVAQIAIALVATVLFNALFASHLLLISEKTVLAVCVFICAFLSQNKLRRTEQCKDELGHILGFKDFIVYTEEDKIKIMLEENPELYYKVLPYAQVLGVTDEWTDKFKNILLEPPTWYVGTNVTYFDYLIMRSCMRRAMITAMTRPQQSGGSRIGRGGGGGRFGGFGGGGFGGGGGGAR